MIKLSNTYKKLGIAFSFPITIRDKNDNITYYEDIDGFLYKYEYGENGKQTYFEDSDGFWCKYEYDKNGNETYYEDRDGVQRGTPQQSSCNGKVIPEMVKLFLQWQSYSCNGKVITLDGKQYKLIEL